MKWRLVAMCLRAAGCAPPCSPGTADCHDTLTGWRYQPPFAEFVDNCPGEFPCGGHAMPIFELEPLPRLPQMPVWSPDTAPIMPPDYGAQFRGPARLPGCEGGIPLPNTAYCIVPGQ
jgi:hypothetical protein